MIDFAEGGFAFKPVFPADYVFDAGFDRFSDIPACARDVVLFGHGACLADVLHIRSFLTDLDDLPGYAAVRRRLFTATPPPASTTVEVSRLFLPGAVIEVEVTAAVPAAR